MSKCLYGAEGGLYGRCPREATHTILNWGESFYFCEYHALHAAKTLGLPRDVIGEITPLREYEKFFYPFK